MGFEVFVPKTGSRSIERGQVGIAATGMSVFNAAELAAVNITDRAVILVDEVNERIAIRAPREEEGLTEPSVKVVRGKTATSGRVNLHGAMAQIGVNAAAIKGRRPVFRKDDLLVIECNGDGSQPAKPKMGRPRKGATA